MKPRITFLLITWLSYASGYNLDVQNAEVYQDPTYSGSRSSYFGFSVALYIDRGRVNDSQVLVGAPRANSTSTRKRGIFEPGVIYRCFWKRTCSEWTWLSEKAFVPNALMEKRDNAWLGARIEVERVDRQSVPYIVICEPRWKQEIRNWPKHYALQGVCYTQIFYDLFVHHPLEDSRNHIKIDGQVNYDYESSIVGFSSHITPNKQGLLVGAPGVKYRAGATALINNPRGSPQTAFVSDHYLGFIHDDYFGYAVTSGYFYEAKTLYFVSSAPRSTFMMGKVFIFSYLSGGRTILRKKVLEGRQRGEFFGASLASCDINNDGRDDLIIGAPNWSSDYGDEGRIYAYISTTQDNFETQIINGKEAKARFGTTVNCLGDLDHDGFADVGVGAPYEDDHGSVYIFNGGPNGLDKQPSQYIRGSDVAQNARGFGISISGSTDIDGNFYDDVAVGAYLSAQVVIFKSRPVVTLELALAQSKNFTLNENSTSFNFDACLTFRGYQVSKNLRVNLTFKFDEFHKRVIVNQEERLVGNTLKIETSLVNSEKKCLTILAHLQEIVQNMIDPIEIAGSVVLYDDRSCTNCPIINPRMSRLDDNLKLAYALDCGSDGLCISDLYVNVSSVGLEANNSFVIGSKPLVNLTVFVGNTIEPAYKAQVYIFIPEPIVFARIPRECDEQLQGNNTATVVCNVGNPLRHNKTIVIELDMRGIQFSDLTKTIQVEAQTQSEDNDDSDNNKLFDIFFHIDADIGIIGKSDDNLYWYSEKHVREKIFRKFTFKHIYEIQKFGISPIQEVKVQTKVPTHWRGFQLTDLRKVEGSIDGLETYKCENTTIEDFSVFNAENSLREENDTFLTFPALNVNCSNPEVGCLLLQCVFGPFTKPQSVAKLTLTIDLQLNEAIIKGMKGNGTMLYVSEVIARISQLNATINMQNIRPDNEQIFTTFLSRLEPEDVALWIIILSVLLGVILLLPMVLGLYKLGFFNRKRKEKLNALRSKKEILLKDEDDGNTAVEVAESSQSS